MTWFISKFRVGDNLMLIELPMVGTEVRPEHVGSLSRPNALCETSPMYSMECQEARKGMLRTRLRIIVAPLV